MSGVWVPPHHSQLQGSGGKSGAEVMPSSRVACECWLLSPLFPLRGAKSRLCAIPTGF